VTRDPRPAATASVAVSMLLLLAIPGTAASTEEAKEGPKEGLVAPGKFIPSFAVKYGGSQGWPILEQAVGFDLLDVSTGTAHSAVFADAQGNSWQHLKRLNPHQIVVFYELGPTEYSTASWGSIGDGWEWLKAHHGSGSADRWAAVGARYGDYLEPGTYSSERLMVVGNPHWQQYWLDSVYAQLWTKAGARGVGVDGIFSDNTQMTMIWLGHWFREGHHDQPDIPTDYYTGDQHRPELWSQGVTSFLNRATPWLAQRGKKLVLNFGYMATRPGDWQVLDAQPEPVFAAMEEGAFVHPWGRPGFNFYTEEQWLTQVRTMRSLQHVRALMNCHGIVRSEAQDITRMEATDDRGTSAWDALWFCLTSFLQGYDDVRQNAYMNFTVWDYLRFFWLKEFDPRYLHLGRARGEMQRVVGQQGHVYLREFDDGWVVVNPTTTDARGVAVPAGQARVLRHDTFEHAETQPLVARFDLASHRGLVLLREGCQVGNKDNR